MARVGFGVSVCLVLVACAWRADAATRSYGPGLRHVNARAQGPFQLGDHERGERWMLRERTRAAILRRKSSEDVVRKGAEEKEVDPSSQKRSKVVTFPLYGLLETGVYTAEVEVANETYRMVVNTMNSALMLMTSACEDCGRNTKIYAKDSQNVPCSPVSSLRPARDAGEPTETAARGNTGLLCGGGMSSCSNDMCAYGSCVTSSPFQGTEHAACCHQDTCAWGTDLSQSISVRGVLVEDDVNIAGVLSSNVPIHGVVESSGLVSDGSLFHGLFDGLLGLGRVRTNCFPTCTPSLLDRLQQQGAISHGNFAMCLNFDGGILTLGGADPKHYQGSLAYTDLDPTADGYAIKLTGINLSGHRLNLARAMRAAGHRATTTRRHLAVELDLNSAQQLMAPAVFQALRRQFQRHFCDLGYICTDAEDGTKDTIFSSGNCAPYTSDDIARFPTMVLEAEDGSTIELEGDQYMIEVYEPDTLSHYWCTAFRPSTLLDEGVHMTLGLTSMLGKNVEFDRENMRVGFAAANNCDGGCYTLDTCSECSQVASCGWCPLYQLCTVRSDDFEDDCLPLGGGGVQQTCGGHRGEVADPREVFADVLGGGDNDDDATTASSLSPAPPQSMDDAAQSRSFPALKALLLALASATVAAVFIFAVGLLRERRRGEDEDEVNLALAQLEYQSLSADSTSDGERDDDDLLVP